MKDAFAKGVRALMHFLYWDDVVKNNWYKRIINYLCDVSNIIYFTYYDDYMIDDKILRLSETCKSVPVPLQIRRRFDPTVIGYEVDIFIKLYLFEYNSVYDLLSDREYGSVLFYNCDMEIAKFQRGDWDEIIIRTNDNKIIEDLRKLGNYY